MSTSEKKPFTGGCHCGHIRYTASLALPSPLKFSRCNCSVCVKSGWTAILLPSSSDFTLDSPPSISEMGLFKPKPGATHNRHFCPKCGVQVYVDGFYELMGKRIDVFSLNVMTLDQPQEGIELSQAGFEYWDRKGEGWKQGPQTRPWPGQCA
ncbi:MAG: hypothetical protein MMC23_004006 [Stictis urceolatum]|nr:hypothetical protein [Stictis urceolata]